MVFIVVQNLFVAPKYTTPHLTPLTLLTTSASSLMNISPFLTKFYSSPKPAIIIFVNFAVSVLTSIPQLPVPLPPSSFSPSSITVILFKPYYNLSESQLTRLQYSFRTLRHALLLKLVIYHSYLTIPSLSQNNRMHRIQAPVTYLQSCYNLPAFTSAQSHLCSTSSQHSLFTSYHWCSATCNIILVIRTTY